MSIWSRTLANARKDLALRLRDPWALVSWLAVPFLVGGMITLLTGGGGGGGELKPKVRLLVADLDGTLISNVFGSAFSQGPLAEMVTTEKTTLEEGRRRMDAGEASGLLVIPEGFGQAALAEQPTQLTLLTNPSQSISPKLLQQTLEVLLDGGFYLHRIFGPELRQIAGIEGAPGEAATAVLAVQFQRKIERLGPVFNDTMITVEEVEPPQVEEDSTPKAGFALLLFPGVLVMAMLLSAMGLSTDLWRERELGTLRRLTGTPGGLAGFLPGKLLAAAVVFLVLGIVLLIPGAWYHSLPFWHLLPAALWLVFSGCVLFLGLTAIQVYASSRRAGEIAGQLVIFPLMMAGGSFFPLEAMPTSLATVGAHTPNGLMVETLKGLFVGGEIGSMLRTAPPLLVAATVIFFLCQRRLERTFAPAAH